MSDYDVAVIGGGAAGLSAALVLSRARRRVLVVDAGSPCNAAAARMHGFLSRDGYAPGELLAAGRREVTGGRPPPWLRPERHEPPHAGAPERPSRTTVHPSAG